MKYEVYLMSKMNLRSKAINSIYKNAVMNPLINDEEFREFVIRTVEELDNELLILSNKYDEED